MYAFLPFPFRNFARHLGLVVCGLTVCLCAYAADAPDIAALIDRYEAVNQEIDNLLYEIEGAPTVRRSRAAGAYYGNMLSTRGNAVVTVGGEFRAAYVGTYSKSVLPGGRDPLLNNRVYKSIGGDFSLMRSVITVEAMIGDRWRAHFSVNLDGREGPHTINERVNPHRPGVYDYPLAEGRNTDNIGEAYIEFLKGGHSGFGFKIGRINLPFGLTTAKHDLFMQSYLDAPDLTGSYLMHPTAWSMSPRLPHASKFLDPSWAAMATYEMRDIVQFQAALFEDDADRTGDEYLYRNGKYRSANRSFRSFLLGVSFLPLEDWELSMAFRNRYDRRRGITYWANSPYRGDFNSGRAVPGSDPRWDAASGQWSDAGTGESFGSRRNEQAFVVGLAAEIPNTKLAASLEYAHGWNQGFNRHVYSDNINLGLSYRLTPRLTLHGQWEWLYVKDRSWMAGAPAVGWRRDIRTNNLHRVFLGGEYELMDGLALEGGWQYEYWRYRSRYAGTNFSPTRRIFSGNTFYLGTKFIF